MARLFSINLSQGKSGRKERDAYSYNYSESKYKNKP